MQPGPNADVAREGHRVLWSGAWSGSWPTSPEWQLPHRDWLSRVHSQNPSDALREREVLHRGDDSTASPGCSALAGIAEAECTRARKCRFFSATLGEDRINRSVVVDNLAVQGTIHDCISADPSRPPSLFRNGRVTLAMAGG